MQILAMSFFVIFVCFNFITKLNLLKIFSKGGYENRDTSFSYAILSIFVRNNCKKIEETCNYFLTFFWGFHFFVLTSHSYLELPIIVSFFYACGVQKVSNLQKNIAVEVCNNYVENQLLLKIMSVALKII